MEHSNSAHQWAVKRTVGHLIEISVDRMESIEEAGLFAKAIFDAMAATPDGIAIVDLRAPTAVFTQPVAAEIGSMMSRASKRRKKTAILLSADNVIFTMQLSRLVREVGDPNRKTFTDAEAALVWLSDALTQTEHARAKEFLLAKHN